jgi:hypothetical protein
MRAAFFAVVFVAFFVAFLRRVSAACTAYRYGDSKLL